MCASWTNIRRTVAVWVRSRCSCLIPKVDISCNSPHTFTKSRGPLLNPRASRERRHSSVFFLSSMLFLLLCFAISLLCHLAFHISLDLDLLCIDKSLLCRFLMFALTVFLAFHNAIHITIDIDVCLYLSCSLPSLHYLPYCTTSHYAPPSLLLTITWCFTFRFLGTI